MLSWQESSVQAFPSSLEVFPQYNVEEEKIFSFPFFYTIYSYLLFQKQYR